MSSPDKLDGARESVQVAMDALADAADQLEAAATEAPPINPNNAEKMTPVTLRLGQTDFRRLRMFGAERGLKHQTILHEALMRYLDAEEGSQS
jgi:predicted DNA binding CopG/RHH family protein